MPSIGITDGYNESIRESTEYVDMDVVGTQYYQDIRLGNNKLITELESGQK